MRQTQFQVRWIDHNRKAVQPSNPDYPNGKDIDSCGPNEKGCNIPLTYPAPRCGLFVIRCLKCGLRAACSTAGRRDDPRSIKLRCKQ